MVMFSRRFVQQMLDECAVSFSDVQRATFCSRLNRGDLSAEWELVSLFRLKGSGSVFYERAVGGKTPDIYLELASGEVIVGDVTAVSDDDFKGRPLIARFNREARRRLSQLGLDPNRFTFQIQYSEHGKFRDKRIQIDLDLDSAFPEAFYAFADSVNRSPSVAARGWIRAEQTRYFASYNPVAKHGGGSWTPFAGRAHSNRHNPVSNALRSKRSKLSRLPSDFVKGIILCDGGCDILSFQTFDGSGRTWSASELIWDFLNKTRSISFVLVQSTPLGAIPPPKQLKVDLYVNENTPPLSRAVSDALLRGSRFPPMMFAPYQARSLVRHSRGGPDTGWYLATRFSMIGARKEIRISARLLRDFFAGKIGEKEFRQQSTLDPGPWTGLFERNLIVDSRIEVDPSHDDDDLIVFQLGPDASINEFR